MHRSLVSGAAVVGVFLAVLGQRAPSAQACSPVPTPEPPAYVSFKAAVPADGAGVVALDELITLDLESHGAGGPREVSVVVTRADGGLPVTGESNVHYTDRLFASWRPSSPLEPQTRYRVDALVSSDAPRPAGALGPDALSFTFTTGRDRLPPLMLAGDLSVALESHEYTTCEPGPCSCVPSGRRRGMRARLTLPAISGGNARLGYSAVVVVTNREPYRFSEHPSHSSWHTVVSSLNASVKAGEVMEVVTAPLETSTTLHPCFALEVSDIAGNRLVGPSFCLASTIPPTESIGAAGGMQPHPGPTIDPASSGAPVEQVAAGCRFSSGAVGTRAGTCGAMAVLVLVLALRARRRGPAQRAEHRRSGGAELPEPRGGSMR